MSSFISYLISGISLGSVYAIIALGYTMVYGIAKMLNFAHGDVIMVGSYVVYVAVSGMGLNPILAILLSIIICTLMGAQKCIIHLRFLKQVQTESVKIVVPHMQLSACREMSV